MSEALRHVIKNPYKSRRWINLKKRIIKEAGSKCTRCKAPESSTTLSVHHKSYIFGNDICDYPDSNLVAACFKCHCFMHSQVGISEGWFKP